MAKRTNYDKQVRYCNDIDDSLTCCNYLDLSSENLESNCKILNEKKINRKADENDIDIIVLNEFLEKFYRNKSYKSDEDYPLTRGYLLSTIELCKSKSDWSALLSLLEAVFSSKRNLSKSFLQGSDNFNELNEIDDLIEKADDESNEKIFQDSPCISFETYTVDIRSISESFKILFNLNDVDFFSGIKKGINQLLQNFRRSNKVYDKSKPHELMNILIILFEIPYLTDPIKFEDILPQVCEIVSLLTIEARATLTEIFSIQFKEANRLVHLHQILQQYITLRLLTTEYDSTYILNEDTEIINTVCVLQCVYYASILAGTVDSVMQLENERIYNNDNFNCFAQTYFANSQDEMSKVLLIHSMDCRYPLIPYEDFINETLNSCVNIENDYVRFKSGSGFSFMKYSFLLNTHNKIILLFYDNRIRMRNECDNQLFLSSIMKQFKLVVDRENLVDDTLNGLEFTIATGIHSLKKRLYIEFKNEETVDEGGVSKEFFQLIVENIFNPDYGMFIYNDETNMFWFNPFPMDDMYREYKLIGIILGLAIYNNVILDLKLPFVLYRKLMGKLGNFEDLKLTHPNLALGLIGLLECESEEVSTVDQNFQISIKDSFGNIKIVDLKENGSNIPLTSENREEYVKLYSSYLLNDSVKHQFNAFHEGFQMVVDESPLKLLFRPDEIELLVCGSKNFDFHELEKITKYDGGFINTSRTIINFWEIVLNMTKEQHSNLLQFTTGSDRIPVGGMQKMDFKIIKNGLDTNRLPTAQTCFNTLLLPDYSSKEKLQTLLLKAITYSKGFGIR